MPGDGAAKPSVSNAAAAGDEGVTQINKPAEETVKSVAEPDGQRNETPEVDEFGLPIRKPRRRDYEEEDTVHEQEPGREQESGGQSPNEPKATNAQDSEGAVDIPAEVRTEVPANVESAPEYKETVPPSDCAMDAPAAGPSKPKPMAGASEWSHQPIDSQDDGAKDEDDDDGWQEMPAYATHAVYDDWGKILAREEAELYEEDPEYNSLGGAGKGYTKVQVDEDAQSATSMDENTAYLFKNPGAHTSLEDDDEGRDVLSQMEATKDMLTEGQRIAYVGIVRLSMVQMTQSLDQLERTKGAKKYVETALEALQMWSQKMMLRLYGHMDIDAQEQIMIEQLGEHGVIPADLTPALMQNVRVKNPAAEAASSRNSVSSPSLGEPSQPTSKRSSTANLSVPGTPTTSGAPPPYEEEQPPEYLSLNPEMPTSKNIDIDLRWTVLCDLFLVLIADSVYDARSRTLLEHVGKALEIPWMDICRFEKRVTDALEMQEAANKENWNEDDHMEERKKSNRNRRLMMMGLATVGGGLVIGLSAGLLAPVIGAGLAAGFTTIGVAGTGGFLAGAGGAAIITTTGVLSGGTIAVRASNRRLGAVKTFEYRPLHNNKRVNLIVTVAGWMTGKVDDVRLPFSTVDPIMGDVYSIHWEPDMLQSMGQTINILATEALTQGLQQLLGSTILMALMASLQLPLILTKLSYLIDNPWSVSQARADLAGQILADSLIARNLGVRPVTLVGFSLGSRVIFSCLKELAKKGAFGLVQNVYIFGSPVVVKKDEYIRARSIVSGRFVNGYATNDWILAYLFRATSGGIMRVAGLAPVDIPGIENINVTEHVPGHMAYRKSMPKLLREVGWEVESLEFSEIEDPDPDDHEKRQRELINEIEEARKELEKKPEKKGFMAMFSKNKKLAQKKDWETYDERMKAQPADGQGGENATGEGQDVLFDVDAIGREALALTAQGIEVKEIKGTLPPMRLETPPPTFTSPPSGSPHANLRQTQSFSGLPYRPRDDINSHTSSPNGANGDRSRQWDYDEYDDHHHDEGEVSMTFEDEPTKPSHVYGSHHASPVHSGHVTPSQSGYSSPHLQGWTTPEPQRPPLHSHHTEPVGGSNLNVEHNAWADEDEDFGTEKEVEMTFE